MCVCVCGFDEEPISRTEMEARVKKFRNSKIADKDEVTGKIMKNGNELVIC